MLKYFLARFSNRRRKIAPFLPVNHKVMYSCPVFNVYFVIMLRPRIILFEWRCCFDILPLPILRKVLQMNTCYLTRAIHSLSMTICGPATYIVSTGTFLYLSNQYGGKNLESTGRANVRHVYFYGFRQIFIAFV
jgi:hypothetical protein